MQKASMISTCPYIGLKDDPDSFLAFSSTGNLCNHCKAPAVPLFEHQETYCLSAAHTDCPVYAQDPGQPFPPALRAAITPTDVRKPDTRFVIAAVGGVLLGIILIWQLVVFFTTGQFNMGFSAQPTSISIPTAPATEAALLPVVVQTEIIAPATETSFPTMTAVPSQTSAPTQKHALEETIQVGERSYFIHLAKDGEGFDYLAKTYKTTTQVIRAINFMLPPAVWVNLPVVISPGLMVVDPALPAFQAYQVLDAEVTIDQLAKRLNADPALVKQYNACPDGCVLNKDDWVIVPHSTK